MVAGFSLAARCGGVLASDCRPVPAGANSLTLFEAEAPICASKPWIGRCFPCDPRFENLHRAIPLAGTSSCLRRLLCHTPNSMSSTSSSWPRGHGPPVSTRCICSSPSATASDPATRVPRLQSLAALFHFNDTFPAHISRRDPFIPVTIGRDYPGGSNASLIQSTCDPLQFCRRTSTVDDENIFVAQVREGRQRFSLPPAPQEAATRAPQLPYCSRHPLNLHPVAWCF